MNVDLVSALPHLYEKAVTTFGLKDPGRIVSLTNAGCGTGDGQAALSNEFQSDDDHGYLGDLRPRG